MARSDDWAERADAESEAFATDEERARVERAARTYEAPGRSDGMTAAVVAVASDERVSTDAAADDERNNDHRDTNSPPDSPHAPARARRRSVDDMVVCVCVCVCVCVRGGVSE